MTMAMAGTTIERKATRRSTKLSARTNPTTIGRYCSVIATWSRLVAVGPGHEHVGADAREGVRQDLLRRVVTGARAPALSGSPATGA
jgi:hypothetical protein